MDVREQQVQSLGICYRLYNLMKSLTTYALKIMTSIHPMHRGSSQHDRGSKNARVVHPMAQGTPLHETAKLGLGPKFESAEQANSCEQDKGVSDTSYGSPHVEEKRRLEPETSFSANPSQARAPKKMVSINDNVETMRFSKKRSRKEPQVDDKPKPLKPILKVGSHLNYGPEAGLEF